MRCVDEESFGAIGVALGISEDAARKLHGRAAEKLKEVLRERGVAPS
jgi:hypothetical protein